MRTCHFVYGHQTDGHIVILFCDRVNAPPLYQVLQAVSNRGTFDMQKLVWYGRIFRVWL